MDVLLGRWCRRKSFDNCKRDVGNVVWAATRSGLVEQRIKVISGAGIDKLMARVILTQNKGITKIKAKKLKSGGGHFICENNNVVRALARTRKDKQTNKQILGANPYTSSP